MATKKSTKKPAKAKKAAKAPDPPAEVVEEISTVEPEVEPEVQPERSNASLEVEEVIAAAVDEPGDDDPSLESLVRIVIVRLESHPDKSSVPRAQALQHLKDGLRAIAKL